MSVPFGPCALTLSDITTQLRSTFAQFTDPRRGKNMRYTLVDVGLSAFSVFFMQSPSFLDYQRTLEQTQGQSHAQTLFGIHPIPTDNPIRPLLDATDPVQVRPMFFYLFNGLNQVGVIDSSRSVPQTILIAVDGVEYFSSSALHGPHCSTRTDAPGHVTYCPTAWTPVMVKPGVDQVIPLAPELVRPPDGTEKQDGDLNAAKRWLATCGSAYRCLGVTLLGEDLDAHEPFCQAVLETGMNFILVCKPTSHALTYEWLAFLERCGAVRTGVRQRWTGRRPEIDPYRDAETLPLREGDPALMVNGCELTTTDKSGKVLYHNTFVTNLAMNDHPVVEGVTAGRCRWKIDNENHNTLKTKGYHFEHP